MEQLDTCALGGYGRYWENRHSYFHAGCSLALAAALYPGLDIYGMRRRDEMIYKRQFGCDGVIIMSIFAYFPWGFSDGERR
jgi:hypothetical protein